MLFRSSFLPGKPGDPRIPVVIELLASRRATNAIPAIVAAMESPDPAVRDAAVLAARQGQWKAAVPMLLRMTQRG